MKKNIKKDPKFYIKKVEYMYVRFADVFKTYFGWEYEDFENELMYKFYKVKHKYNPHNPRKATFSSWMVTVLGNHVRDQLRKTTRNCRIPLQGVESEAFLSFLYQENMQEETISTSDPAKLIEIKDEYASNLMILNEEERKIYSLLNSNNSDILQLCKYLNIGEKELHQKVENIRLKLEKHHNES